MLQRHQQPLSPFFSREAVLKLLCVLEGLFGLAGLPPAFNTDQSTTS